MTSSQAEAFGFPNPVVGIAGFAVVLTSGVVVLAGAQLSRCYWLVLQAGATFGVAFVHWLIFQSLYRIGVICPYCMAVWAVTIPLFVVTTWHNIRCGNLPGRRRFRAIAAYSGVIVTGWFLVIAGLIARRFWEYWQALLR